MSVDSIRQLYSYTQWANARMVECVRGLSEEQFTRRIESSFPTIRDTLAHIALAEWIWLRRWKGENPTAPPEWAHEPPLPVIEQNLRAIEDERAELLASLSDQDLHRAIDYRNLAGNAFTHRLDDLMTHVANHSSYHRGQLTTMLRQVGAQPVTTDLIAFLREPASNQPLVTS